MTALEIHQPTYRQQTSVEFAAGAFEVAERICRTEFVPKDLRNRPEAVLACMMAGVALGLDPMTSLGKVHLIQGRPTLSAELMRALVLRAGHELWIEESTDKTCTVAGKRSGSTHESRFTWTWEQATKAKLTGKDSWRTYPRAMLLARASSELCRALFADCLSGFSYCVEEVSDFGSPPPIEEFMGNQDDDAGEVVAAILAAEESDIEDAVIITNEPPLMLSGPAQIGARCGDLGIDRDGKLAICSVVAGREVESTNDLQPSTVAAVLKHLAELAAEPICDVDAVALRDAFDAWPEGEDRNTAKHLFQQAFGLHAELRQGQVGAARRWLRENAPKRAS